MSEAGVMNTEEWNGEWDGDANALWSAGLEEGPAAGSEHAVLAALGLGGTPPGPGGGVPAATAPSSGGAFVRPEASGWFRPWMKNSAIGLVLVGLPLVWLASREDEAAVESSAVDEKSSAPVVDEVKSAPEGAVEPEDASAASAEPAPAEKRPVTSAKVAAPVAVTAASSTMKSPPATAEPATATREPSLAEELAFVQGAKALVASRRWTEAEARLDAYRRDFPKQRLAAEARVLRVEMLVAQGKKAEARQVAGPVLAPGSPYRERVLSLVGGE